MRKSIRIIKIMAAVYLALGLLSFGVGATLWRMFGVFPMEMVMLWVIFMGLFLLHLYVKHCLEGHNEKYHNGNR